jgi:hypothetical protein
MEIIRLIANVAQEATTSTAFDTLTEVLTWIVSSSGGAYFIVAWFVSWALEKTQFWKDLSSQIKVIIIIVSAGIIGAVAQILLNNPDTVAMIDPYVRPIIFTTLVWLTTQGAHLGIKRVTNTNPENKQ